MKRPEQNLQLVICKYLTLALPDDGFFFSVPNGGWRTKAEAGIMKATGAKSGMPDLIVIHRGAPFGLEVKSLKGQLSADQRTVHAALGRCGMDVRVCRSVDDVQAALDAWQIPVRARTFGFKKAIAA